MIKYGNLVVRQTVRKIVNCMKEALKMEGDKRRIRLNQLLHIEYQFSDEIEYAYSNRYSNK
ncbi:hypothetical protein BpHYR1_054323 [Brachionus plicatilis]|uniref:Uncharacterized protein n=1 Tax=Brachionus plicatilis TaxID=10195 RepID=A0A3M7Q372_BRAPC|nr:hypothetical protein BpHYR1_054323 [Brachionus plicatilis]